MVLPPTTIAGFPTELLAHILDPFSLDDLTRLMRVCTHWRAVILSHPTYTSQLVLPAGASTARIEFFVLQAGRAVVRGRALEVDVDLSRCESRRNAARIIKIISRGVARVKRARLVVCAEVWDRLEELLLHAQAPRLRELELDIAPSNPLTNPFEHTRWLLPDQLTAPLLDTLILSGTDFPRTVALSSLAYVQTIHYTWPWSAPRPNRIDISIIKRVFPALSFLSLTGHIELVPLATEERITLDRLALHTRTCSTQWPTLQPQLVDVRNVECCMIAQDGVDAIMAQLRAPLLISATMQAGKVRFMSTGTCGKTFALVYGGAGNAPPSGREGASDSRDADESDDDGYSDSADDYNDVYNSLIVDITQIAQLYTTAFLEVDLWDIPRDPATVEPEYSALRTFILSWSDACPAAPLNVNGVDIMMHELDVPLGGPHAFSACPNLRVLRLENRTWLQQPVWVQLEEVEALAEQSLFGVDFTQVELHLAGVQLAGVPATLRTIFASIQVVSLSSSPYPIPAMYS